MRNYMRYIAVIVKLQKKVSPKTVDVSLFFYICNMYINLYNLAEVNVGHWIDSVGSK
jgi:hypothetical protein